MSEQPLDDLLARLERERQAADRLYNDALTALDKAIQAVPALPDPPAALDASRLQRLNEIWNVVPSEPQVGRSLKGRVTGLVWRMIVLPLQAQTHFNATVVDHLNRGAEAHRQLASALDGLRHTWQHEIERLVRFESLLVQFLQTITAYIDTKDRSLGGSELRQRLGLTEQRVLALKRDVERAADLRPEPLAAPAARGGGSADAVTYVLFEDRFRGPAGDVRERVAEYVPLLASGSDVVDVGCGRGELLALLQARGVPARGVDANPAMVDLCRSQGLDVEHGDALSYLEGQRDGSIGGLVAIQVVEHFEPGYLTRFLQAAFHKMKPGSPLILETINPACWMAFFETYLRDLTHQRPLHPDTLKYLVEASGFSAIDVRFRRPVADADRLERVTASGAAGGDAATAALAAVVNAHADKLNARLFSSMDYAIVGRR